MAFFITINLFAIIQRDKERGGVRVRKKEVEEERESGASGAGIHSQQACGHTQSSTWVIVHVRDLLSIQIRGNSGGLL